MEIDKLIKEAILEKNSSKKEAYRAIKAEILLQESAKNAKPINEVAIIRKLIKQRKDSASIYDANSRKELADIEREQIKYLKDLLPPEVSQESIKEAILLNYPIGYSQKEMGAVIKKLKDLFPTAEGKLIADTVKLYIK